MRLHELAPTPGSKKRRMRVGRGDGSGWGGTAGRGHKGQRSRSGASITLKAVRLRHSDVCRKSDSRAASRQFSTLSTLLQLKRLLKLVPKWTRLLSE